MQTHFASILFFGLVLTSGAGFSAQAVELFDFEIEDQFKQKYNKDSWGKRTLIFVIADDGGANYCGDDESLTAIILQTRKPELFQSITVGNFKGVPRLIRGLVRKARNEDEPILMDWQGEFNEKYLLTENTCNILIFNAAKKLVYQQSVSKSNAHPYQDLLNVLNESAIY